MESVEVLYRSYAGTVYWVSYGLLHDREAAMDVTQTVFLRAMGHMRTITGLRDYQQKAWLCSAAKNASVDLMRKSRREIPVDEPPYAEDHYDASDLPEAELISAEQREEVIALVDGLPEAYRQPILLYYFAELGQQEIAKTLALNESTLRSRLHRAKAMLLHAIEEGGVLHG
ncbi:MAG TPA: sigma-70 family RNA polymerase sigma factor [Feifaniaceae bacterium]|nr:sigma-70 family RNA polymerase sigma factor [Feifaniaceae bacterium]